MRKVLGADLLSLKHPRNVNLDANDCLESGWYYMPADDYANKNIPTNYFIFCTIYYGSSDIVQFGFGIVTYRVFFRVKSGATWSPWKEFALTSV